MSFKLGQDKEERRTIEDDDRLERLKEYNRRQKRIAKVVGENFATASLLMILVLMVGFIWTEVRIFSSWRTFIGDAGITIVLYILADICASSIGSQGGKLDDDYIKNHISYLDLRERVMAAGIVLMDVFCDWQIDVEYEFYMRRRCKDLKIDYKEYMENYHGKTLEELQALFPLESNKSSGFKKRLFGGVKNAKTSTKAAKIFSLNQISHIDLTPDILLTDGMVKSHRGGVGISGEEYIKNHTVGWKHIIITAFFAIVAAVPVFNLVEEFSVAMIIYTVFKLSLLLFRMWVGYSRGAKGYSAVEPVHLQAKAKYLYKYLEFLKNKTYLDLGDKYDLAKHDVEQDEEQDEENGENSGEQPQAPDDQ